MNELLFVYGSLKDKSVQIEVTGSSFDPIEDVIEGYTLSKMVFPEGNSYPLIIEAKNKNVKGMVLSVNASDLIALDAYETHFYIRVKRLLKSGREAWVYISNKANLK